MSHPDGEDISHPKLELKTDMGPEEFQNKLYAWFEQRGILAELRSHLRCQMTDALKTLQLGNKIASEQKLRQSASPKLQALNLLIAEYFLRKKYHYTLSVFSSEVPIISSFPDFTKTVIDMANDANIDDSNKHLELHRFDSTDVWDILEAMGLPSDSEQADTVYNIYTSNSVGEPLLVCIIRLLPAALREYCKNKSPVKNSKTKKVENGNINQVIKKTSFVDLPGPAYSIDETQEKERRRKWIKDTVIKLKKKEKWQKKKSEKGNTLDSDSAANEEDDCIGILNGPENIEEEIVTELQKRMQEVYDHELRIAKHTEEKKCGRALRDRERALANDYKTKVSELNEKKAEFEKEMEESRVLLEIETQMKKKYLCDLADHLHEHRNIVAHTLESVQQQAELMKEKVRNELKVIEQQTNVVRLEETRLKQERVTVEAMKRDLEVTKKNLEDTIKSLAYGDKKLGDEKISLTNYSDRMCQTIEDVVTRDEMYDRCHALKTELDKYKRIAIEIRQREPSVEKESQTELGDIKNLINFEAKRGQNDAINVTPPSNNCLFVLNDINQNNEEIRANPAVDQSILNNGINNRSKRPPKSINIGANSSKENIEDMRDTRYENQNDKNLLNDRPKTAAIAHSSGFLSTSVDKAVNTTDNEVMLKISDLSFRDAESSELVLLRGMLKRMQDENTTLRTYVQEQRSHIRSLTTRQSELRDDLNHARSAIAALSSHVASMGSNGNFGLRTAITTPPLPAPSLAGNGRHGFAGLTSMIGRQLGGGEELSNFSSAPRRSVPRRPDHTTRYNLAQIREARRNARRNGAMSASTATTTRVSRGLTPVLPAPPVTVTSNVTATVPAMPKISIPAQISRPSPNDLHIAVSISDESPLPQSKDPHLPSRRRLLTDGALDLAITHETRRYALDITLADESRSYTDDDTATISDDVLSEARRRLRRLELESEAVERSYRDFRTRHSRQEEYIPRTHLPISTDSSASPIHGLDKALYEEISTLQMTPAIPINTYNFDTQRPNFMSKDPIKRLKERTPFMENKILTNYVAASRKLGSSLDSKPSTSRYYPESFANYFPAVTRFDNTSAQQYFKSEQSSLVDSPLTEFRKRYDYFRRQKPGVLSIRSPTVSISCLNRGSESDEHAKRNYNQDKQKVTQSVKAAETDLNTVSIHDEFRTDICNNKSSRLQHKQSSTDLDGEEMPAFVDVRKLIIDKSSSPIHFRSSENEDADEHSYPSVKVKKWIDKNKTKYAGLKPDANNCLKDMIDSRQEACDGNKLLGRKQLSEEKQNLSPDATKEKIVHKLTSMRQGDSILQRLLSNERKAASPEKLSGPNDKILIEKFADEESTALNVLYKEASTINPSEKSVNIEQTLGQNWSLSVTPLKETLRQNLVYSNFVVSKPPEQMVHGFDEPISNENMKNAKNETYDLNATPRKIENSIDHIYQDKSSEVVIVDELFSPELTGSQVELPQSIPAIKQRESQNNIVERTIDETKGNSFVGDNLVSEKPKESLQILNKESFELKPTKQNKEGQSVNLSLFDSKNNINKESLVGLKVEATDDSLMTIYSLSTTTKHVESVGYIENICYSSSEKDNGTLQILDTNVEIVDQVNKIVSTENTDNLKIHESNETYFEALEEAPPISNDTEYKNVQAAGNNLPLEHGVLNTPEDIVEHNNDPVDECCNDTTECNCAVDENYVELEHGKASSEYATLFFSGDAAIDQIVIPENAIVDNTGHHYGLNYNEQNVNYGTGELDNKLEADLDYGNDTNSNTTISKPESSEDSFYN